MVFKLATAICLVLLSQMPNEVETARGPDLSKGYVQQGSKTYTFHAILDHASSCCSLSRGHGLLMKVAVYERRPKTKDQRPNRDSIVTAGATKPDVAFDFG
jgi:hypothetical protein